MFYQISRKAIFGQNARIAFGTCPTAIYNRFAMDDLFFDVETRIEHQAYRVDAELALFLAEIFNNLGGIEPHLWKRNPKRKNPIKIAMKNNMRSLFFCMKPAQPKPIAVARHRLTMMVNLYGCICEKNGTTFEII